MDLVSINIPVFSRLDLIKRCLWAIRLYTEYRPFELVLIDDGSPEREVTKFLKKEADVFLSHEQNMGIAQSRYDGVEASSGYYICEMDSDTIVTPGWLTRLVNTIETGNGWGPGRFEMAIVAAMLTHQLGYFLNRPDCVNASGLIQVEVVGTACTLFRNRLVDIIGSFDPLLHNLWSDMDFCKRLAKKAEKYKKTRRREPKVVIDPRVTCYHHGWIDPETGDMAEEGEKHTRSHILLNDRPHKQWSLDSMKLIFERWGVKHPWMEKLEAELGN